MKKLIKAVKAAIKGDQSHELYRTHWAERCALSSALSETDPRYLLRPEGQLFLVNADSIGQEFPSYSYNPIGVVAFIEGRPPEDPDLWVVKFQVGVMPKTNAPYEKWEYSKPFNDFSLAMRHLWQNREKCQFWF